MPNWRGRTASLGSIRPRKRSDATIVESGGGPCRLGRTICPRRPSWGQKHLDLSPRRWMGWCLEAAPCVMERGNATVRVAGPLHGAAGLTPLSFVTDESQTRSGPSDSWLFSRCTDARWSRLPSRMPRDPPVEGEGSLWPDDKGRPLPTPASSTSAHASGIRAGFVPGARRGSPR